MAEHTPTTEEIRTRATRSTTYPQFESPTLREDWDRWLAAHDAEVRAQVSQEDPETQGWRMVYIERHNVRTAYERATGTRSRNFRTGGSHV